MTEGKCFINSTDIEFYQCYLTRSVSLHMIILAVDTNSETPERNIY